MSRTLTLALNELIALGADGQVRVLLRGLTRRELEEVGLCADAASMGALSMLCVREDRRRDGNTWQDGPAPRALAAAVLP